MGVAVVFWGEVGVGLVEGILGVKAERARGGDLIVIVLELQGLDGVV